MRSFVVLLAAAALAAAEPVPAFSLTWDGRTGPTAEPVAGWWRASRAAAAAWWRTTTGAPLDETAACAGLVLVAQGVPTPGRAAAPRLQARLWAPPEGLLPALTARLPAWPGVTIHGADDGSIIVADGAPAGVAATAVRPQPGLRVEVHGSALADEIARQVESDPGIAQGLRLLRTWRLVATVQPDGKASLATGLPARWFTAPDGEVVARIPADARAAAVIGFDGGALSADLVRVFGADLQARNRDVAALAKDIGVGLDGLIAGCSGTWAGVWHGGEGFTLVVPRSPTLDRMAALFARVERFRLPEDATPAPLGNGPWGARTERSWIVADSEQRLRAWLAPAPAGAPSMGFLRCDGEALAMLAEFERNEGKGVVLAELPLISGILGHSPATLQIMADLGVRLPPEERPAFSGEARAAFTAALRAAGPQRIAIAAHEGDLALDLDGDVLPWVVPGLVIRRFAGHLEQVEALARLRAWVEALRRDGHGALPADMLAGLPERTPAEIAAAGELARRIAAAKVAKDPWREVGEKGTPLALAAEARDGLRTLLDLSAALDDAPWTGREIVLREAEARGRLDGLRLDLGALTAGRALAVAGRALVAAGDPDGLVLVERARRLQAGDLMVMGELTSAATASARDDAWLLAGLTGLVGPERLTAWADEPWPGQTPWRSERLLMIGGFIARAVGPTGITPEGADRGVEEGLAMMLGPALYTPQALRASAVGDLQAMAEFFLALEQGRTDPAPLLRLRSPLSGLLMPALSLANNKREHQRARHALLRLAWRLLHAGPPADAAAAAAIAPLQVRWGEALIPLEYVRRGERGFTLRAAAADTPPPGLPAHVWKRLHERRTDPASVRVSFGQSSELLVTCER